jgi:DNA invertase Pin-like site-specific DNA recombinase
MRSCDRKPEREVFLEPLLAGIAEFERELIRERTEDGRKRAMARGVKFRRKLELSSRSLAAFRPSARL